MESAVIGLPHPDFGEAVAAVVVARRAGAVEAAAIVDGLKERIANYKVPKQFTIGADLPLLPIGKVDKQALRERAR